MATKHDEFKVYAFSFDEDELQAIVDALINAGNYSLAYEIRSEAGWSPVSFDEVENVYDKESACARVMAAGIDAVNAIKGDNDTIASLTFNIDTSGVKQATKDLSELEAAANSLADAYDRLHKAQLGPVEYHSYDDVAEAVITSLIDAGKTGRVVIDRWVK